MIRILYLISGKTNSGCWRKLDEQVYRDTNSVSSVSIINVIREYGGDFIYEPPRYFIDFEAEDDAIIFKLRYGV